MLVFLAQRPAPPVRHFDIADGFAITLILMLFMVLTGVALVARRFRDREKELPEDEALENSLDSGGDGGLSSAASPSQHGRPRGGVDVPWERDADWWKREAADDE